MNYQIVKKSWLKYKSVKPTNFSREVILQLTNKFRKVVEFKIGDSIEELIKKLGGTVHYCEYMSNIWAGSIFIHRPERFDILIEKTIAERTRYTLAYFLGHYVLHGFPIDATKLTVCRREIDATAEAEATWFMHELLIPQKQFSKDVNVKRLSDCMYKQNKIVKLSQKYKVSLDAIIARLKALEKEISFIKKESEEK
jgi:Zn-dependent peptidase ImmA (M78 family)